MIYDKLSNSDLLIDNLSIRLQKAMAVLQSTNFSELENGKYDVDGENIFYMVQRYTAKPVAKCCFETHEKYIDIQYVSQGCEAIGIAPKDNLTIRDAYQPEKDVTLYQTPARYEKINIVAGEFCILYPNDGHMPQIKTEAPEPVTKVVFKVLV